VRANGDTPDAAKAREFGAEGIGLCVPSTCHGRRAAPVYRDDPGDDNRGSSEGARQAAAMQQSDSGHLGDGGLPSWSVCSTRRCRFLPKWRTDDPVIRERIIALHEFNPISARGSRLAPLSRDIRDAVRAIVRAPSRREAHGKRPEPRSCIVIGFAESSAHAELTEKVIAEEEAEFPSTMI